MEPNTPPSTHRWSVPRSSRCRKAAWASARRSSSWRFGECPAGSCSVGDISARPPASLRSARRARPLPLFGRRTDGHLCDGRQLFWASATVPLWFLAFEFDEEPLKTPVLRIVTILLPKVFTIVYLCECYSLRFGILWAFFLVFFFFLLLLSFLPFYIICYRYCTSRLCIRRTLVVSVLSCYNC